MEHQEEELEKLQKKKLRKLQKTPNIIKTIGNDIQNQYSNMSAGYVIAQLRVTNPENYKEYIEKVNPIVKKFDGEFLVRNGEYKIFDGETNFPRIIVLKFPSYERALELSLIHI